MQHDTDVSIGGLEEFTFFASKNEAGTWGVTGNSTGMAVGGTNFKTRAEAIDSALALVSRVGAQRAREPINAAPKLTDDVKRAALKAATDLPPVVERRGAPSASVPGVDVEGQVDVATAEAVIAKFRAAQKLRDIEFHVVESFADLPPALQEEVEREYGKGGEPQGLMKERDGVAHVVRVRAARYAHRPPRHARRAR